MNQSLESPIIVKTLHAHRLSALRPGGANNPLRVCGRTPQAAGLTASLRHWVGSKPTQQLARIVYSRDSPGYGRVARGFSSHVGSYCFMVIASSLFPCIAPWVCIRLRGVQGHPRTPHLELPSGRAPYGLFTPHREPHRKYMVMPSLINLHENRSSSQRRVPTRVSNPVRSPGFRPSPSGAFQPSAFATGGPPGIYAFYRSPRNTLGPSRSLAPQYPRRSACLQADLTEDLRGRLRTL